MHYVDEGAGAPVLLLHGEPTWAFLYRKMIPTIAGVARVVAPDYFGFGRSDKPTRIEDYSYDFHYESIERFADELDLRDTTVVVQDWGGPIGLRLAVERPERVARLVILNTGIGAGRAPSEEWLRFREFVRRVGTDLVPGQLVRISAVTELADDVVEAYNAPFPTPESKAGVLAFPELVPTELEHPSAAKMLEVRAALEQLGQAGARPLLRLRPDLHDRRGRAHGVAHPGRRTGRDRRRRGSLPPGGEGRGDRRPDRPLPRPRRAPRSDGARAVHGRRRRRRHAAGDRVLSPTRRRDPGGCEELEHVEVEMSGLTFFLSTKGAQARWDPAQRDPAAGGYRILLEFYVETAGALDAKYAELTGYGYASHCRTLRREPDDPLRDGRRPGRKHDPAVVGDGRRD